MSILIQAIRIYNQDVGIEFVIENCALLIMKIRKRPITEGIERLHQERIRTLREKEITSTREYLKRTPSNKQRCPPTHKKIENKINKKQNKNK